MALPACMCRFELLARIRVARGFGDLEQRRLLVKARLLAFHALFHSSPTQEDMLAFLARDAEFVPELVHLLQAQWLVPEDIRMKALRVLAGAVMRLGSSLCLWSILWQDNLLSVFLVGA